MQNKGIIFSLHDVEVTYASQIRFDGAVSQTEYGLAVANKVLQYEAVTGGLIVAFR